MEKIAQGAEAKLYRNKDRLIKDRIKKNYRIKQMDEQLRKQRTKTEARLMRKAARTGVSVPQIFSCDNTKIEMKFIDAPKVKDILEKKPKICKQIGKSIAKLHSRDIIHGDLTTSNMLLGNELYFIDFGLAFHSQRIEDKAVDLRLLKQALESTHYSIAEKCWAIIKKNYNWEKGNSVLRQLEKIKKRGRYKK